MSFVAQIQANIADFEKNMGKAVDVTNDSTNKMESKFGNLTKSFASVAAKASLVGAAVAAVGVGLTKLAISAGNASAKINNLSTATNLSTDVIQELSYVATASNSSFEGLTRAMDSFQRRLKSVEEEGSKTNEMLAKLGVSTTDVNGEVRKMDDVLLDTFSSLGDMENGLRKSAIGTELFGRSWNEVALIVSSGSKGIEQLRKEANELGLVIDKDTLKSADNFATAMGLVSFQVDKLKTKIGASLVPILENTLLPFLQNKVIPAISKVVESIAKTVDDIMKSWGKIVDYFTSGDGAEMWETIRKAAINLKNDLRSIFEDIKMVVVSIWNSVGDDLTKGVKQTAGSVASAIKFIVETFDNFLNILRAANPKEALAPTKKFFIDLAKGIKEGLSTSAKEGVVAIGELTQAQTDAMTSGKKWGVQVDETKEKIDDIIKPIGDLKTEIEYVSPAIQTLTANNLALNKSLAGIKATMGGESIGKWILGGTQIDLSGTDGALTADSVWNVDNDVLTAKMDATRQVVRQNYGKMNEDLSENLVDLGGLISGAVNNFAGIIGEAFAGDFSDFGASLLSAVGGFAQQFGALLIAAGIASKQLQALITNPFAAIAAGAALVALGALTSKKAQSMTKNLTSGGGYSSAPSMQTTTPNLGGSEYRGAYRDDFTVNFKIGNDELIGTLDTAQQRRNRI